MVFIFYATYSVFECPQNSPERLPPKIKGIKNMDETYFDQPPLTELGYSVTPSQVLSLIRQHKPITLDFLEGYETCSEFTEGKILGEGKSGTVFEIDDDNSKGLPVVLKEFNIREAPVIKNLDNGKDVYVLSSSLNDIVMSSLFHSFYDGGIDYCISFPYFEGFFVCGNKGYAIIEQLDDTMSKYIGGPKFKAETFRAIMFQVLYATRFLNSKEVVHNDMHGKNVMTRSVKGIAYRGTPLESVKYFAYVDGETTYCHPNNGIIAKIMDFDFAAKYSHPSIVAQKVYNKKQDEWNLQFRYSDTYDLLTFVAYMVFYTTIRTPGKGKVSKSEVKEAREIVYSVAEYIVDEAERQLGHIKDRGHYNEETDGKRRKRDAVSKLMDMVSVPQYRPYEKYCHLDLSGVLNVSAFKRFRTSQKNALVVASF